MRVGGFLTSTLRHGETNFDITSCCSNFLLSLTRPTPNLRIRTQPKLWLASCSCFKHTHLKEAHSHTHLSQVVLNDVIPHLWRVQLRVESRSDHRHDVIDAAEAGLISQQIPARAQKQGWKDNARTAFIVYFCLNANTENRWLMEDRHIINVKSSRFGKQLAVLSL